MLRNTIFLSFSGGGGGGVRTPCPMGGCVPDLVFCQCILGTLVLSYGEVEEDPHPLNLKQKQKKKLRKIVNIFLSICFNVCFGCSKEPSH